MSDKYEPNKPDFKLFQTDYSKVAEIANKNVEPLNYEDTLFAEQANDIKKSFESQIDSINSIEESAEKIAKTSRESSDSSSKYAKISIAISVVAIITSIAAIMIPIVFK